MTELWEASHQCRVPGLLVFVLSLTDKETNRRGSGASEEEEAAQNEQCHPMNGWQVLIRSGGFQVLPSYSEYVLRTPGFKVGPGQGPALQKRVQREPLSCLDPGYMDVGVAEYLGTL